MARALPAFLTVLERKGTPSVDTLSPGSSRTLVVQQFSPTRPPSPHAQHCPQRATPESSQPGRMALVAHGLLFPPDFPPTPGSLQAPLPVAGRPDCPSPRAGAADKTSLCLVLEGRGDVCVLQDRGRGAQASSHPPPKLAFQRKGHLRPQRQAQHGHHSPARLAPGPCHMEQGGVSPAAWPRLPLTPQCTHTDVGP